MAMKPRPVTPLAPHRPEYINPAEAAARWSVSVDTIRRMIASGKITGYRLNNRIIRVNVDEVDSAFKVIPTVRTIDGAA